jgi:protein gp37
MNVLTGETNPSLDGIAPAATVDWVIVGGESGASARPMHPDWARSLRNQCAAAGVPFLFKQWGEWAPRGPESLGYPVDEPKGIARVRINTAGENDAFLTSVNGHTPRWMQMSGKKRAGRLLDGVQHDRFPEITA